MIESIKIKAAELKREIFALYLAARDPRTPWYAKVFIVCVVAYALSPIDLIPDPIPILGYLDDLLLLPFGVYVALKMIPREVLTDCRAKAASGSEKLPHNWYAAVLIISFWLLAVILLGYFLIGMFSTHESSDAQMGYVG